jgi:hypothetical protein
MFIRQSTHISHLSLGRKDKALEGIECHFQRRSFGKLGEEQVKDVSVKEQPMDTWVDALICLFGGIGE